ncbi:MAG: hypothetical protein ABIA63_14465, partial [bacterium]
MVPFTILFLHFLLIPQAAAASEDIIFSSGFEDGITALAREHKSGEKQMELIVNDEWQAWPDSGFGVINYESPELKESFEYKKRIANRLMLAAPLKKNHVMGADVRTSNLYAWTNSYSAEMDTGYGAMFGNYGLRFPVKRDVQAELHKVIKAENVFHVNFYIRVNRPLLDDIQKGMVLSIFNLNMPQYHSGIIKNPDN